MGFVRVEITNAAWYVLDSLWISPAKKTLVWWSTLEKKNTSGQTYAQYNFYWNNIILKEKIFNKYYL